MLVKYKKQTELQSSNGIWVYDLPYLLAKREAKNSGKEAPRRDVEEKFLICQESNNKDKMTWTDFIYRHIPWSYGLWHLRRFGLVYPNPEIVHQQNRILVGGFSYLYKEKIRKAIEYANFLMSRENSND